MKHTRVCPYCDGKGKVYWEKRVKPHITMEFKKKCFDLRKAGNTYRAIGKMVKVDHPQKIKFYIDNYLDNYFNNPHA